MGSTTGGSRDLREPLFGFTRRFLKSAVSVEDGRLRLSANGSLRLAGHPTGPGGESILAVPEGDAGLAQIVWRHFHVHLVSDTDADEVLAHLARDMRKDLVAVGERDAEHGAR
jgi:hypothetical protein